jgi:membrane protein implicated in regulation of membrane protease activity
MTAGMTTPTLSTAAAAGDGLRMFGLPWWFQLALLPLLAAVLFLLVGKLRRREGSDR